MNGFVSLPAAPASPEASTVSAGDFWPEIDINELRAAIRIGDTTVTHQRIVAEIEAAVVDAMAQLAQWTMIQQLAGHATATAVPFLPGIAQPEINGKTMIAVCWLRAIRCAVAAALADGSTDLTATAEGMTRGAEKRSQADDFRRMATAALRQIRAMGTQQEGFIPGTGGILVDLV